MAQPVEGDRNPGTTGTRPQQPSVTVLLKQLVREAGELARAEAHVIKLEMQESTRAMILDGLRVASYSALALLGILSLMAFLIIAFGDLISPHETNVTGFWLSALIIGIVFTALGGAMAYRSAKRLGQDIRLPNTRIELRTGKQFIKEELVKLKEATTP